MVGGPDFETAPFNLATQGHRQPGSSIKPFTLITALEEGISPETVYASAPQDLPLRQERQGNLRSQQRRGLLPRLLLDHLRDDLLRQLDLRPARRSKAWKARRSRTAPARSPATIHKMGYDDPISTNPAMVLGGLKVGVTPLGWTYAYSTIGNNGDRVSGTLAPRPGDSPVAYTAGHRQGRPDDQGRRQRLHPRPGDRRRAPPKKRRASSKRSSPAAPAPTPRSAPKASGARPGRPRTTATPGSAAASATKSPPASGSATPTRRRR